MFCLFSPQNIDALESRAGIQRVLQCHGSFASARCMSCQRQFPGMAIHRDIMSQTIPKCPDCHPPSAIAASANGDADADGTAVAAVESLEDLDADGLDRSCRTFGVIKPEITFFGQCGALLHTHGVCACLRCTVLTLCFCSPSLFSAGESLPESFRTCLSADRSSADLVIVMGSSLRVQPVAGMLSVFSHAIPMVLINRELVGEGPDGGPEFDLEILGKADEACAFIAMKLGWNLPEIDPALDTFREPEEIEADAAKNAKDETQQLQQNGGQEVAASAAASNLLPPSLRSPAPVPRPESPQFVAPNRYLFSGASHGASGSSPRSSAADSSSASVSASEPSLSPDSPVLLHSGNGFTLHHHQPCQPHVDEPATAAHEDAAMGDVSPPPVAASTPKHVFFATLVKAVTPLHTPLHAAMEVVGPSLHARAYVAA